MTTKKGYVFPEIGGIFHYQRGIIYIDDGALESNGRVSNFWYWRRVRKDGSLGTMHSGHLSKMKPCTTHQIVIKVTRDSK